MVYVAKAAGPRFWVKVDRDGPPHPYDPDQGLCWLWTASLRSTGYGQFYASREQGLVSAHRFAYALEHGPIPDGQVVRHTCDRPLCVNAAHLIAGTQAENCADTRERGNPFGGKISHAGTDHPLARLTTQDVDEIRRRRTAGDLLRVIAADYGIGTSQVHRITTGQQWTPNR